MRPLSTSLVAAVAALLLGFGTAAIAQTPAPTSPIAPSAEAPPSGLGGIGAGNALIAPGAAPTGDNLERIGPGGGLMAPGLAGSVSGTPMVGAPALPTSRIR
jgi:hypothetical protein